MLKQISIYEPVLNTTRESTLNQIESTVIRRIILEGTQDNEIIIDNDYVVQNEDENVVYRHNPVHAVFYEVYGPMRTTDHLASISMKKTLHCSACILIRARGTEVRYQVSMDEMARSGLCYLLNQL